MLFRKNKKEILEVESFEELCKNGQVHSGITKLLKKEKTNKTKSKTSK